MTRGAQIALFVGLAIVGGLAGLAAALVVVGPGPLLGTEVGQRVVQLVGGTMAPPLPDGIEAVERGDVAPDFAFATADGGERRLAEFRGRPVLINYWASWCGPCIEEMPLLDTFAAAQGADGVQVLGVALDEPAAVAEFLDLQPVAFPIVLEVPGPGDSSVQMGNRNSVLPYSVLIDAEGRVVKTKLGAFDEAGLAEWVQE